MLGFWLYFFLVIWNCNSSIIYILKQNVYSLKYFEIEELYIYIYIYMKQTTLSISFVIYIKICVIIFWKIVILYCLIHINMYYNKRGFPISASGEESICQYRICKRPQFDPSQEDSCGKAWPSTPVFLPGEFRGQMILAGNGPQDL